MNFRRKKPVVIELPDNYPRPELATLRGSVEANPTDVRARIGLAAQLQTAGLFEEAYREYLEAIALLSNNQFTEDASVRLSHNPSKEAESGRLSYRAFAHWMAARTLESMGCDADARKHWKGCADDCRTSIPHEDYLPGIPYYVEAMAKLQ